MDIVDKFHKLIGQIVVEFNFLEDAIESQIWFYLSGLREGLAKNITHELNTQQKLDLLHHLVADICGESTRIEFNILNNEIKNIIEERNRIIHSTWFIGYGAAGSREEEWETKRMNFREAKLKGKKFGWDMKNYVKKVQLTELEDFLKKIDIIWSKTQKWFYDKHVIKTP